MESLPASMETIPCQVTLKIENLMTYFDRPDVSIQKCGIDKDPTSTGLLARFDDRGERARS
ncbi:MAG: hypothetical protein ABWY12_11820 [Burkholderiales bacterium]